MLANARAKLPGVNLFQADMTDFSVLEPVDALVCLFSSIGYVFPESRLRQAASSFASAIRPGGCLLLEPWVSPEDYDVGRPSVDTYNDSDLALSRICIAQQEEEFAVLNFSYSVAFRDHRVEHFEAVHKIWMAPHDLIRDVLEEAGFAVRRQATDGMTGRGLFVGKRL